MYVKCEMIFRCTPSKHFHAFTQLAFTFTLLLLLLLLLLHHHHSRVGKKQHGHDKKRRKQHFDANAPYTRPQFEHTFKRHQHNLHHKKQQHDCNDNNNSGSATTHMFETTTKRDPSTTKPNKRQLTPNLNPTQPRAITRIDVPHTTDRKHTQTRQWSWCAAFSQGLVHATGQQSLNGQIPTFPNLRHCFVAPKIIGHDAFHGNAMHGTNQQSVGQIKHVESGHHGTTHRKRTHCHVEGKRTGRHRHGRDDVTGDNQHGQVLAQFFEQLTGMAGRSRFGAGVVQIVPRQPAPGVVPAPSTPIFDPGGVVFFDSMQQLKRTATHQD